MENNKGLEQQNYFKIDFNNLIKISNDFDNNAEAIRWESFQNHIGEREIIEGTFERLGYDRITDTIDLHALLVNVSTEKNSNLDHLWIDSVTDPTNPQAELWRRLCTGDKIILSGIIDKYIYKSELEKYSRLSLSQPIIQSINSIPC
jgi:hypothetical protein